jgi:hypothetical protein
MVRNHICFAEERSDRTAEPTGVSVGKDGGKQKEQQKVTENSRAQRQPAGGMLPPVQLMAEAEDAEEETQGKPQTY